MKNRKRVLSAVLALLIVAGCVTGGVVFWRSRNQQQIKVYSVADFAMTDYYADSSTTDGLVDVDGLQTVTLSDTQTVTEVDVQEGDTVKKGDVLLSYDTTLTEIDLQKKEVEVKQLELDLATAQKELEVIKTYRPGVYIPGSVTTTVIPGTPPEEEQPFEDDGTLTLLGGDGSYANPFVYEWQEEYSYTDAFLYQCMRGLDDAFVQFVATGTVVHVEDGSGWHSDAESHWKVCSDCGENFDQAEHTWEDVIDKAATETETGLKHRKCSICGYEEAEQTVIDKVDHDHTADSAGWHSDANGHWKICRICQEKFDTGSHDYKWVTDKEATETEAGSRHQECKDCGYKGATEEIPATGHTHTSDDQWHSDESGHWQLCTSCGEKLNEASHSFEWVTDKAATETEAGSRHQECSVCHYKGATEEIPATGGGQESQPEAQSDSTATTADTQLQASWTMEFQSSEVGYVCQLLSVKVGTMERTVGSQLPALPEKELDPGTPDETITDGISYTKEEILQMRTEAEQKVKELDLSLRQAKLEQEKAEQEFNNGTVVSQLDGKVTSVLTEEEARSSGEPMIKVTSGGGYYISGSVSELLLDTVQPGQTVTVRSWESGVECEGTVTSVSEYPTDGTYWNGNTNVSMYPFVVFVEEDAGLNQNEYAEITYGSSSESGSGLYLESMFIRSENGRSYIYVADADGKLEKRYISTGKSVWGSYTEIKSGLTVDEYVAFPYGDGLTDGAETVVSTMSEFYGW